MVKMRDESQDEPGPGRRLGERFMEVAPRMRPATHVRHPGMGFDEAGVRFVAIRLQQTPEAGQQRYHLLMPPAQAPVEDDIATRATDHPEPALHGFSGMLVGILAAHGRFVCLEIIAAQQILAHEPVDDFQPARAQRDPVHHRLPREPRAPALRLALQPVERLMVDILGDEHPRHQPGRDVAARCRPRRGRRHRERPRALETVPILRADDLALEELRRDDVHLEGPFLAHFFEKVRSGLHLGRLHHHRLRHRQLREEFLRALALGRSPGSSLVADLLQRGLAVRPLLELLQRELELGRIQLLALAPAEHALLQPGDLQTQLSIFDLQFLVLCVNLLSWWHASY